MFASGGFKDLFGVFGDFLLHELFFIEEGTIFLQASVSIPAGLLYQKRTFSG